MPYLCRAECARLGSPKFDGVHPDANLLRAAQTAYAAGTFACSTTAYTLLSKHATALCGRQICAQLQGQLGYWLQRLGHSEEYEQDRLLVYDVVRIAAAVLDGTSSGREVFGLSLRFPEPDVAVLE